MSGCDTIELSQVCGALRGLGIDPPAGGYRVLVTKAQSAAFPAEKRNGRWQVRRADLPLIAEALGLAVLHQ